MAKDKDKTELKPGDPVEIRGTVVHAHEALVSVRLDVPPTEFAPTVTMHSGAMKKVQDGGANASTTEPKPTVAAL